MNVQTGRERNARAPDQVNAIRVELLQDGYHRTGHHGLKVFPRGRHVYWTLGRG